ncbi:MAG: flagellar protein [Clostridia bacterium]|nr:flagellar protein [Clostridia bacterium]
MSKIDMNQMIQKTKVNNNTTSSIQQNVSRNNGPSFQDVLSQIKGQNEAVKFSKHATERLSQRNIVLTEQEIKQIDSAIDKAEAKGIKDALILMDNKAFVANIKNKTIITAATQEQLKDSVFTKIDGAVII